VTLLVGAIHSSGLPGSIFQALSQVDTARGIILAADSRWTFPDGRTEGGAVKVFGIGPNGIAAYAGSAIAGEDAVIALAMKRPPARTLSEWTAGVKGIIIDAWRDHQPNDDGLEIFVCFSFKSGVAGLVHFSSTDGFIPQYVNDIAIVGPERTRTYFQQALRAAIAGNMERAKTTGVSVAIDSCAALIVAAVNDACELRVHRSVGGKILCAYTMLGRAQGVGVTRLSPSPHGIVVDEVGLESEGQTIRKGFTYQPPH